MFASMLGTFLMIVILFLISLGIIAGIVAVASNDEVVIDKNTVLVIKMDKPLADVICINSPTIIIAGFVIIITAKQGWRITQSKLAILQEFNHPSFISSGVW